MTVNPLNYGPEWHASKGLVDYPLALAEMEARVAAIQAGSARELVWLLEHPSLYTAGTSANMTDLLMPGRFPVYPAGRGGQYTYHGPGQRVAYVMADLRTRGQDVRVYVSSLENWLIAALRRLGVAAFVRPGRVGVWVKRDDQFDDKIGAIGVRIKRWVTFHGISLNVNPDLSHYAGIVPCGITGHGVTSLHALGVKAPMAEVDKALRSSWEEIFEQPRFSSERQGKVLATV